MVYVMGAVFSRTEGFTQLSQLWGAILFHTVTMALGIVCIGRAGDLKDVQPGNK